MTDGLTVPALRSEATETGLWPEDRPETLLPAERFEDAPAGERFTKLLRLSEPVTATGPDSPTVALWLGCRCAGWPRTPTSREFYDAVRARRPTSRQCAILDMWANQADWTEVLQAWAEHAYTLRGLVAALRSLGAEACGYNAKRRQYRAAFHVGIGERPRRPPKPAATRSS